MKERHSLNKETANALLLHVFGPENVAIGLGEGGQVRRSESSKLSKLHIQYL